LITASVVFFIANYGNAQKMVTVKMKNGQGESVGTAKISPAGKAYE
jgi:hypothetical protein